MTGQPIPHAVTVGFTCGIAIVILASQLKDLGGLTLTTAEPGLLLPKLAVLAAPYPQVVAGTPTSWSFKSGTFRLSYSTQRADGQGNFSPGAQTLVSVPAVEYPSGYHVSVTGGQVLSAPGAPVLTVVAAAGAGSVDVVVTP